MAVTILTAMALAGCGGGSTAGMPDGADVRPDAGAEVSSVQDATAPDAADSGGDDRGASVDAPTVDATGGGETGGEAGPADGGSEHAVDATNTNDAPVDQVNADAGISPDAPIDAPAGDVPAGLDGPAGDALATTDAPVDTGPACPYDGGCAKPTGSACVADGECTSRHCADGWCCESACGGACVTCGGLGTEGTCLPVLHGTDFRSCAGASTCSPAGLCKKAEGESCGAASECALGTCAAGPRCCADASCQRTYGWSHPVGGGSDAVAAGPAGQIALAGLLAGSFDCADLDPGPAVQRVCSPLSGKPAVALTLLDRDGRFLWARAWAGTSNLNAMQVAFVPGGVLVSGSFSGSVDFDPSAHSEVQTAPPNYQATYLSRFDLDGNWVWTRTWNAVGLNFLNVAAGADGAIGVVGRWYDTLDLDPGTPVVSESNLGSDLRHFVLKLSSSGTYAWHRVMPNFTLDGVDVAADGAVGIGGRFSQAADFDPGPATVTIAPTASRIPSAFISVFDAAGTFSWARTFDTRSELGNDAVRVAALDGGGWAVAGSFAGVQADFDPLGNHDRISTHWTASHQPDRDVFVSLVSATGAYVKTVATGSTLDDDLVTVRRRKGGGVWMVAHVGDGTDVDPGTGVITRSGVVFVELGSQLEHIWSAAPPADYYLTATRFTPSEADGAMLLLTSVNKATDFDPGPGTDTVTPPFGQPMSVLTKYLP